LETDSPDIPPVELNGGINYPKYIHYNLMAASEIMKKPIDEIAETSLLNAAKIFRFKI
jgi:Tat protein secretion system quality control protein TatD with DNase activity